MFKTLAIAAALTLAAAGAQAAEVGVRHSAGYGHQTVTNGRAWSSYNGSANSSSLSIDSAGGVAGTRSVGGGAGTRSAGGGGAWSIDVTRTSSEEHFSGGSTNRFSGGSGSTFSETSVFAK